MLDQIMVEANPPKMFDAEITNSDQHGATNDILCSTETTSSNETVIPFTGSDKNRDCVWEFVASPGNVPTDSKRLREQGMTLAVPSGSSGETSENEKPSSKTGPSKKSIVQAKKRHTVHKTDGLSKKVKHLKTSCLHVMNEHDESSEEIGLTPCVIDAPIDAPLVSVEKAHVPADDLTHSTELSGFPALKAVPIQTVDVHCASANAACIKPVVCSLESCSISSSVAENKSNREVSEMCEISLDVMADCEQITSGSGFNELAIGDNMPSSNVLQNVDNQMQSSEELKLTEVDEDDFFVVPIVSKRSSNRLRRNSIQLFRKSMDSKVDCEVNDEKSSSTAESSKLVLDDATASESAKLCDSNGNISYAPSGQQSDAVADLPLATELHKVVRKRKRKNLSHQSSEVMSDQVEMENVSVLSTTFAVDSRPTTVIEKSVLTVQNVDANSPIAESFSGATTNRPQRRCATQPVLYVEQTFHTAKRRKKTEPSVEDIYRNRLWRSQMPKERSWESIPETPILDPRNGTERLFTTRKHHCAMKFDDVPNQTRLRQRRQKALARGWKPLTKKRLAALDNLLAMKLEDFEVTAQTVDSS